MSRWSDPDDDEAMDSGEGGEAGSETSGDFARRTSDITLQNVRRNPPRS